MQAELARVRAEQEALPPLVAELQEALEAETTDFMRKESGGCAKCALCAVQHHPLQSVRRGGFVRWVQSAADSVQRTRESLLLLARAGGTVCAETGWVQ